MLICDLTEYIPEPLRNDEINRYIIELHKQLCRMRNFDLKKVNSTIYEILSKIDPNIDSDGLEYWNSFIEPWVGTSEIQRFVLKLLDIEDGKLVEWYDDGQPVNTYSFLLKKAPPDEKMQKLIDLSISLKNIESKLTAITDINCPGIITPSGVHPNLDYYLLSDIHPRRIDGVWICFSGWNAHEVGSATESLWSISIHRMRTSIHFEDIDYWDMYRLDESLNLNYLGDVMVWGSHLSYVSGQFLQLFPVKQTVVKGSNIKWTTEVSWNEMNIPWSILGFNNPWKAMPRQVKTFAPDNYTGADNTSTYNVAIQKVKRKTISVGKDVYYQSFDKSMSEDFKLNDKSEVIVDGRRTTIP